MPKSQPYLQNRFLTKAKADTVKNTKLIMNLYKHILDLQGELKEAKSLIKLYRKNRKLRKSSCKTQ